MSTDFWAGYASGAVGIIVGNPLDVVKVRQQAQHTDRAVYSFHNARSLLAGATAPILGYGALNALLFMSYNRTEAALNKSFKTYKSLGVTWAAGAVGGLAIWGVSTPTELVKCRVQMAPPVAQSSLSVAKNIWLRQGYKGFYVGGLVTALRDSIGYGFYFWSYELAIRSWPLPVGCRTPSFEEDAPRVMLCGGLAGIVTWASVFPLDVIKTKLQTETSPNHEPTGGNATEKRRGAWAIARKTFRDGGMRPFFRGLTVCSVRAFIVNAAQWAVYESLMYHGGEGRFRDNEVEHLAEL